MDFLGLSLFPGVIFNLLYHYLAKNYGMLPNVVYRLLTAGLIALVPYGSSIPDSLFSLFALLYPLLVYAFIKVLYEKKKREKQKVSRGVGIATFSVVLAVLIGIIMLVSCQFKYCALVIATESMTGELNKGDVAIYQKYEGQDLEEGTIIVFDKGDGTTVHRIVEIEVVDGTIRYTTKGDANDGNDLGYVYKSDIKGTTLFKVAYFGYPTLWLRSLFKRA
jgi:signal peptidase